MPDHEPSSETPAAMPDDEYSSLPVPPDCDPGYRYFLENTRSAGDTMIFRDPETGAELEYYAPTEEESIRRQRKFEEDRAAFFEKKKLEEEKKKVAASSSTGEPSLVEEDEEKKANPPPKKKKKANGEEDGAGSGKKVLEEEEKKKKANGEEDGAGSGKKVLEEEEKLPNELAVETLNADAVASETNSNPSIGVDGEPHVASGLHVWPTHIMLRPESDFKNRLMHVLGKPFSQEEYDKLVGCATIRKPATKERRTREGVKYYLSDHEVNKSYFDRYPDLEEQVKSTSYPNQLALLRGFFFWLKNVWHEDQFRPWRDDFLQYKVVPIIE